MNNFHVSIIEDFKQRLVISGYNKVFTSQDEVSCFEGWAYNKSKTISFDDCVLTLSFGVEHATSKYNLLICIAACNIFPWTLEVLLSLVESSAIAWPVRFLAFFEIRVVDSHPEFYFCKPFFVSPQTIFLNTLLKKLIHWFQQVPEGLEFSKESDCVGNLLYEAKPWSYSSDICGF